MQRPTHSHTHTHDISKEVLDQDTAMLHFGQHNSDNVHCTCSKKSINHRKITWTLLQSRLLYSIESQKAVQLHRNVQNVTIYIQRQYAPKYTNRVAAAAESNELLLAKCAKRFAQMLKIAIRLSQHSNWQRNKRKKTISDEHEQHTQRHKNKQMELRITGSKFITSTHQMSDLF